MSERLQAFSPDATGGSLTALLDTAYEQHIRYDPYTAASLGEPVFPDRVSHARYPFPLEEEYRRNLRNTSLQLVKGIGELTATHMITPNELQIAERIVSGVRTRLNLMENTDNLRPVDHSVWTPLVQCLTDFRRPYNSEEDIAYTMQRTIGFSEWVTHAIDAMEEGKRCGDVQPVAIIEATLLQLHSLLNTGRLAEQCMVPLVKARFIVPNSLRNSYAYTMEQHLLSGYKRMATYLRDEYAASCRNDLRPGLCQLPEGYRQYERLLGYASGDETCADPGYLYHEAEASFYAAEQGLMKIARSNNLSVRGLINYLKANPSFRIESPDQLKEQFQERLDQLQKCLPKLFYLEDVPDDPCEVYLTNTLAPAVTYKEKGTEPAHISLPATSFSHYTLNDLLHLAAHEGVPGHHLQLSRQLNAGDVHPYMGRLMQIPIFREGWAMYAESLIAEMDIEINDFERASMLSTQLSIARGVMLDVALHHYGTSIDEAKVLRHEMYGANDDRAAHADILRFVAWPGQVVTYTGDRTFKEYRHFAERKLGSSFDVRDFHGLILGMGEMPLSILGEIIGRWCEEHQMLNVRHKDGGQEDLR